MYLQDSPAFGLGSKKQLPSYHSLTGCDTTFPNRVGKIKPLKTMLQSGKCKLLQRFWENLMHGKDKLCREVCSDSYISQGWE